MPLCDPARPMAFQEFPSISTAPPLNFCWSICKHWLQCWRFRETRNIGCDDCPSSLASFSLFWLPVTVVDDFSSTAQTLAAFYPSTAMHIVTHVSIVFASSPESCSLCSLTRP